MRTAGTDLLDFLVIEPERQVGGMRVLAPTRSRAAVTPTSRARVQAHASSRYSAVASA